MIVCYLDGGVRASIDVFGHWNTRPDSCGHGTPKVTVIGCVTAARWRPVGYTRAAQDGAAEAFGGHGLATGTDDDGAAQRSEGGSATSWYYASMNQPPDCRLCAAAARRGAFPP